MDILEQSLNTDVATILATAVLGTVIIGIVWSVAYFRRRNGNSKAPASGENQADELVAQALNNVTQVLLSTEESRRQSEQVNREHQTALVGRIEALAENSQNEALILKGITTWMQETSVAMTDMKSAVLQLGNSQGQFHEIIDGKVTHMDNTISTMAENLGRFADSLDSMVTQITELTDQQRTQITTFTDQQRQHDAEVKQQIAAQGQAIVDQIQAFHQLLKQYIDAISSPLPIPPQETRPNTNDTIPSGG